jgi:hypothetical protein
MKRILSHRKLAALIFFYANFTLGGGNRTQDLRWDYGGCGWWIHQDKFKTRRNNMAYLEASLTRPAAPASFNPIKWLLRLEADYRQADMLRKAVGDRLDDMGMTRKQADTAFYGRFGKHRYNSK